MFTRWFKFVYDTKVKVYERLEMFFEDSFAKDWMKHGNGAVRGEDGEIIRHIYNFDGREDLKETITQIRKTGKL